MEAFFGVLIVVLVIILLARAGKRKEPHRTPYIPPLEPQEARYVDIPETLEGMPIAYQYTDVDVAILRGQEPNFAYFRSGDTATLKQEPENTYDPNAVAVYANGTKIGYLYKGRIQDIVNDYLRMKRPTWTVITGTDAEEKKAQICISLYKQRKT